MIAVLVTVALVVLAVHGIAFVLVGWLADRHVHKWEITYAPTHLYLRCPCGALTPGWSLFELPPGCERTRIAS